MEWHDCWDIECGLFLHFHERLLLFVLKTTTIVQCEIIPEFKVENWRFMTFCDGLRLTYCQKGWGTPRKCHILGSPLPQKCQVDHMMSLGSLRTVCRDLSPYLKGKAAALDLHRRWRGRGRLGAELGIVLFVIAKFVKIVNLLKTHFMTGK